MTDSRAEPALSTAFRWLLGASLLPWLVFGLMLGAGLIWGADAVWWQGHFGPKWGFAVLGISLLVMLGIHALAGTVAVLDLVADRELRRSWRAWAVLGLAMLMDLALLALLLRPSWH